MNYENYLRNELLRLIAVNEFDLKVVCESEQLYAKRGKLESDTIYCVLKYLSSEKSFYTTLQPVNITIITSQENLSTTQELFRIFTDLNNLSSIEENNSIVKQQLSYPVVLSNFNEIGAGYKNVLYMSITLYELDNVADLKELEIDEELIKPLTFNINYTMTGDSQQTRNQELVSTEKSLATLTITMSVPLISNSEFCKNIFQIMHGKKSGNTKFHFLATFSFEESEDIELDFVLINSQLITAPNQAPSLTLSFMR